MIKVIVETKSRSKHVFKFESDAEKAQLVKILEAGITKLSYLKLDSTYFNPDNITSVKIEED